LIFFASFFCIKTKKWRSIRSRHSFDFFASFFASRQKNEEEKFKL